MVSHVATVDGPTDAILEMKDLEIGPMERESTVLSRRNLSALAGVVQ